MTKPEKDAIAFARRQMVAAVEGWAESGHSVQKLIFLLQTMPIEATSGDAASDERLVARNKQVAPRMETPSARRVRQNRERRKRG